jgi:hypothetical protein
VQGVILACEGADDEAFLHRMLDHLRITGVDIRKFDGKPQLPTFLLGLRDSTEFEAVRCVGIVRDADMRAASALQSVTDRLRQLRLPVPRLAGGLSTGNCEIDGLVRTFGVFIMPDGRSPGELEDLCLAAIENDLALTCAQEFLDCVHARTGTVCPEKDTSKARLNAWLASRTDPTLRMGHAVASRDIPPDSRVFDPIRAFLTQLAAAAASSDQAQA